ncbi:hypothetical protein [Vallitalea guaymasensis]|uniref:Uncharacterized protein n=1 Tax=Vallitalea guaymasensis TaxID=1185412 RepID=A0A8J8MCL5_9FIRM|nr:hypothetical protein [Vallitalea guaymasensis]QUH30481.1 hypothetical protein HYG85_16835 [Vallitalea guaymasensis]
MGKVTLCTDKYLDAKPIVALLETELFEIKLFYKTEDIRDLKPKYLKYMLKNDNINIIYGLIKTRETLVKSYFFKIIDWLCDNYAIDISDYAKYKVCEKTFYFSYEDIVIDLEKTGIHCKYDFDELYLSEKNYWDIMDYIYIDKGYDLKSG